MTSRPEFSNRPQPDLFEAGRYAAALSDPFPPELVDVPVDNSSSTCRELVPAEADSDGPVSYMADGERDPFPWSDMMIMKFGRAADDEDF